ncbi:MAG: asparagine synthase (glutamine-hydrolyzing) [Planctomycetes bacterium]|nr:asparagine synthase (glutamine-hydrolyzing) [Planctomycetota bacterium]
MCGIAGILTSRVDLDLAQVCAQMQGALAHRGPDDRGIELLDVGGNCRLGLVHTRLAILDLSTAGHQPMHNPESDSWVVFNGEIYNFRTLRETLPGPFRSNSDTEIILKMWSEHGPAAIDKIGGMFAWALYDARRRQLHLVRDRLGIKPLYVYRHSDDILLFASELRALLASGLVPRKLSRQAIDNYLAFGAVNAPLTLLEGVESLLPAEHWQIECDNGRIKEPLRRNFWSVRFASADQSMRYDEAVERVRPVLLDSMARHMVADTPVGVFLSGGIDSSAIVGSLTHLGFPLQTFSVLFSERGFDESVHALQVSQTFGTDHRPLQLRPDTLVESYQGALDAYDQPSIDGVNTYLIAQAVSRAGMKVALSGLGGDELFAGYPSFQAVRRLESPLFRGLALALGGMLSTFAPHQARTEKLAAILRHVGNHVENYCIIRQVLSPQRRRALLHRDVVEDMTFLPLDRLETLLDQTADCDAVNAQSLLELSVYVGDMLLRDADQMSMAHPVEVRVPLLDHLLVETLATIPGRLKLRDAGWGEKKRLLIDALPVTLPRNITHRPKMGFVFPWEVWLRDDLREHVAAVLNDQAAIHSAGLDAAVVKQLTSDFDQRAPGIRYSDVLALVHLLHWVRRHGLTL